MPIQPDLWSAAVTFTGWEIDFDLLWPWDPAWTAPLAERIAAWRAADRAREQRQQVLEVRR